MILSVTAPRKGMGQTITSINLAAKLSQFKGKRVLLIDANKHCNDIEYYLSERKITKGLDDFISMYHSGLLNAKTFMSCIQSVPSMDIMAANQCLDLNGKIIEELLILAKRQYEVVIIDTISGSHPHSQEFFKVSHGILIVLSQSKLAVENLCDSSLYRAYQGKLSFVINRHIKKLEEKKIQFCISQVTDFLQKAGYQDPVFPLDFDPHIMNQCNEDAVLNYILNQHSQNETYLLQMEKIIKTLMGSDGQELSPNGLNKKQGFFNNLGLKGAVTFASKL